jgi:hypothetical protein
VIKQVMQCDGCHELLRDKDGTLYAGRRCDDLEWEAARHKWTEDRRFFPSKWYCPTCQAIRVREGLVPPAPPAPKRKKGRAVGIKRTN